MGPHSGTSWKASIGGARRSGALRAFAVWCAAGLAVPVLVMGWIAWRGGLGPFRLIFADYVLPLYSRVGRVSVWEAFTYASAHVKQSFEQKGQLPTERPLLARKIASCPVLVLPRGEALQFGQTRVAVGA